MKKLLHIIMIALILLGLVTPALAQEQTDNFNVSAKVGAAAVVVADVPEDVTVVGVPAKVVRVHGQKDEEVIHDIEEGREYYSEKLEDLLKAASFHSSRL